MSDFEEGFVRLFTQAARTGRARLFARFNGEALSFATLDRQSDGVAAELEAVLDRRWLDGLLGTAD